METYLNIKVSSGVLRLRGSLLLLLLLGRRRALWGWRSLCTKELRRVRVWMLEMMRRWCLMMLKMMRRSWGKGGHEMFLASDHIDTRLQQYHPATTGAHSQCSSRVLLKFLLAWRRLATPRCTTVNQEWRLTLNDLSPSTRESNPIIFGNNVNNDRYNLHKWRTMELLRHWL